MADDEEKQPIIIKKIKKGGGGHHGGAWKVAYADFVTAMMAFFLLLWLLNVTTEEQKNAISNYFDPTHPRISQINSGSGGILSGTTLADEGALADKRQPLASKEVRTPRTGSRSIKEEFDGKRAKKTKREQFIEKLKKQEEIKFREAADKIKQAIENNPDLAELAKNLIIDITPEGLRIQLVDQSGKTMFPSGSARMFEHTQNLLSQVADIAMTLPNDISVRGHTDGVPYRASSDYSNWELSSDRANASRRGLIENGIPEDRISNVQGKADTEHLFPENPTDPRNRRISIILLNQDFSNVALPPGMDGDAEVEEEYGEEDGEEAYEPVTEPETLYNKSQGSVVFP
jgi:chemotaxis protein MotB